MKRLSHLWKFPAFWLSFLSLLYIALRITNLTSLPIFTDEAIYIRWSQIGANDASWRFISLTDGKQPLFTWFMMAALRVIKDPLIAGRVVSVVSGFFGMIGMYVLGQEVFKRKRIGLIASFLYVISPFALMYDRLAIYDSWVSTLSIWNLYIAILFVRNVRLDIALIFGMTLGVGMLNKTSAFFSLYLLPFTLILFDWKSKNLKIRLATWVGLASISAILSQVIYSILRLSPYFYIIAQKNTIFVYPFKEWITHPFTFFIGNLHGEFDWLIHYLTVPWCILIVVSFFFIPKRTLEKVVLMLWWILPFTALALFGKVLYPRFILFMVMPLILLVAVALHGITSTIKRYSVQLLIVLICCAQALWISWKILTDIKTAPIPKSDIGQLIGDWPSGWGVKEIVTELNKQSHNGKLAVYTEGTFGLLPYALEIYLHANPNIEIHGVWPPSKTLPVDILEKSQSVSTYYITNLTQEKPQWPMDLILEVQKGINTNSHIRLYKISTVSSSNK